MNGKSVIILVGFVCLLFSLIPIAFYVHQFSASEMSKDPDNWGHLGSYIGGVIGPIFGFGSLLVVLHTLHLQREELDETKSTAYQQSFETTFFNLLSFFKNTGRSTDFKKETIAKMHNLNLSKMQGSCDTNEQIVEFLFSDMPIISDHALIDLAREVHPIIKHISEHKDNQEKYMEIFQSQITSQQANCLSLYFIFCLAVRNVNNSRAIENMVAYDYGIELYDSIVFDVYFKIAKRRTYLRVSEVYDALIKNSKK